MMSELIKWLTKNLCIECHLILPSKKEGRKDIAPQCPRHPSAPVSLEWQGYVVIMHPTRSEIAKRLKVEVPEFMH